MAEKPNAVWCSKDTRDRFNLLKAQLRVKRVDDVLTMLLNEHDERRNIVGSPEPIAEIR